MKERDCLYVDRNSWKLEVDWKFFGRAWLKMGVVILVMLL